MSLENRRECRAFCDQPGTKLWPFCEAVGGRAAFRVEAGCAVDFTCALWDRRRRRPVHPAHGGGRRRRETFVAGRARGGHRRRSSALSRGTPVISVEHAPFRAGLVLPAFTAATRRARRSPRADGRPGRSFAPARRRPCIHGPGLPAGHARGRRHPAGRLRAGAVAAGLARLGGVARDRRARRALRSRRFGGRARPRGGRAAARAPVHASDAVRSPARVPDVDRVPGGAARVGLRASGRAATSTRTSARPRRTGPGYREHGLPLDAIVLDSPWATQYNTWEFNPHQFPDAAGYVSRLRADGVRTVVWVAPWVNLESRDGQYPLDAESGADARRAGAELRAVRCSCATRDGEPFVARWWMGTGSPVDFTSRPRRSGGASRPSGSCRWASRASRPMTARVGTCPTTSGSPTGRTGAARRLGARAAVPALDAARAGRGAPGSGVLFGRPGWTGQQAVGITWGGDQPSDFWSLRTLVAATLTAAASGISNWSHDIGGYLGERLVSRCPKELLLRWVQFGCFTPLMHAHGRFEQEPWTYDEETLEVYRGVRAAARAARPVRARGGRDRGACGLPIVRPGALAGGDWAVADAYGYGPSLWVAPVLEDGAREREVDAPAGDWIDLWRAEVAGGGEVVVPAPLVADPGLGPARGAGRHLPRLARRARPGRRARVRAPARGDALGRAALRPCRRAARRRHGDPLDARLVVGLRRRARTRRVPHARYLKGPAP